MSVGLDREETIEDVGTCKGGGELLTNFGSKHERDLLEAERTLEDRGFLVESVRKSAQNNRQNRNLISSIKNVSFKRIMNQKKGGKNILHAVSDDFYCIYDYEMSEILSFTFKSESEPPPSLVQIHRGDFAEEVQHMNDDLRAFSTYVRLYLLDSPG